MFVCMAGQPVDSDSTLDSGQGGVFGALAILNCSEQWALFNRLVQFSKDEGEINQCYAGQCRIVQALLQGGDFIGLGVDPNLCHLIVYIASQHMLKKGRLQKGLTCPIVFTNFFTKN